MIQVYNFHFRLQSHLSLSSIYSFLFEPCVELWLVTEIIHLLEQGGALPRVPATIHHLLCSLACRGAIMFGQEIPRAVAINLLSLIRQCSAPFQETSHSYIKNRRFVFIFVDFMSFTAEVNDKFFSVPMEDHRQLQFQTLIEFKFKLVSRKFFFTQNSYLFRNLPILIFTRNRILISKDKDFLLTPLTLILNFNNCVLFCKLKCLSLHTYLNIR